MSITYSSNFIIYLFKLFYFDTGRLSTSESKKKKETKKIPNHIIGNVSFSLAESEDKGDGVFQNLNRDSEIGNFDYALVPEGLIAFTKAINILFNTIGRICRNRFNIFYSGEQI